MEDMKNSSSFAAVFHRFISQPAASRSSALLSLAAFLVLSFFGGLCGYTVYFSEPGAVNITTTLANISSVISPDNVIYSAITGLIKWNTNDTELNHLIRKTGRHLI